MSIWDKFDKSMDIEGLKEDCKGSAENGAEISKKYQW